MNSARLFAIVISIVFVLNMAACCGGGTTVQEKQTQVISQPTVGDQLQDLDTAYKNGAITKEEYEKLKQDIMNKAATQPK